MKNASILLDHIVLNCVRRRKRVVLLLFIGLMQSCSSIIPKNNLVACYSFKGGNAKDLAGTNHGQTHGATAVSDRFGRINHAFRFDSPDDYIEVNNLNFFGNVNGSFVAWVKFDSVDHIQYVASVGDIHSIESYISFIRLDPDTQTLGIYQREIGKANWLEGSTKIIPGVYYCLIMTSDGKQWSIYIDGIKEILQTKKGENTGKWIGELPGIDNFVIGNSKIKPPYAIPYLSGVVDGVLMYNRALTEEEIIRIVSKKASKKKLP